jgi:hypothetical protein
MHDHVLSIQHLGCGAPHCAVHTIIPEYSAVCKSSDVSTRMTNWYTRVTGRSELVH